MSADNWTQCPKCNKMVEDAKQKQIDKARVSYGKVSPEEYEVAILASKEPAVFNETLRENYWFYMKSDGFFKVSYSAFCDRCGFKHTFTHSEQIEI